MGDKPKTGSAQADSDPLPYVQVDRAVRPKVGLLAGALGVSTQHALGSLVEWWDLNGDPRTLTEIVEATEEGETPAVVITGAAARERFQLAAGKPIEPTTLVHLGLLEPIASDAYRVRGMSRYFAPIEARKRARALASVAGKASAESRRKATGTAQPKSDGRSGVRSGSGSAPVREPVREPFEQPPNSRRTPPNPSGQRSAVNDQLQIEDPAIASLRGPDLRHAPLVADLVQAFEDLRKARYPFNGRDAKAVSELLKTGAEPSALLQAWRRALVSPDFPKVSTLSELKTHLAHFVGQGAGSSLKGDWRANVDHAKSWGVE